MAKRITNYENNKEIVDRYAVAQVPWGIDTVSGEITPCSKIPACASLCGFAKGENCGLKRVEWLSEEYIDIKVAKQTMDKLADGYKICNVDNALQIINSRDWLTDEAKLVIEEIIKEACEE